MQKVFGLISWRDFNLQSSVVMISEEFGYKSGRTCRRLGKNCGMWSEQRVSGHSGENEIEDCSPIPERNCAVT